MKNDQLEEEISPTIFGVHGPSIYILFIFFKNVYNIILVVVGINMPGAALYEVVLVGPQKFKGEIVSITSEKFYIQVFENTGFLFSFRKER